jgi:hypothetical protein
MRTMSASVPTPMYMPATPFPEARREYSPARPIETALQVATMRAAHTAAGSGIALSLDARLLQDYRRADT